MMYDATRAEAGADEEIGASPENGARLLQLDGLRGVAAIAVALYHVHILFALTLGFERAYLFVDVFFILSGFVLSLAWTPPVFAADFEMRALMIARVRRLWPMIGVASVLGAAVCALLGETHHLLPLLMLSLLVVPAIWQGKALFPLNGPQWSLFWELCANAAHIFWLRRLGDRGLLAFGLVMGLALIVAIGICNGDGFGPNGNGWWLALPRIGWSYTVGMLIARRYRTVDIRPILSWWHALASAVIVVLLLPYLPVSNAAGDALTIILVFPAIFWLLVTARRPSGGNRWLARLGALSFPLYAVHVPLLTLSAALPLPRAASAAIGVTAALLLAVWLSRAGDLGCRRWSAKRAFVRAASMG